MERHGPGKFHIGGRRQQQSAPIGVLFLQIVEKRLMVWQGIGVNVDPRGDFVFQIGFAL